MLKWLAMPEEQAVTRSSLSLLRGPALRTQRHPPTIRYEDQTPEKNFAFTHFPLWMMMKSNTFTPNSPYCQKERKLLWASFPCWPSSFWLMSTNTRPVGSRAPKGSLRCVDGASTPDRAIVCVSAGHRPRTVQTVFYLGQEWRERRAKSELRRTGAKAVHWTKGRIEEESNRLYFLTTRVNTKHVNLSHTHKKINERS